MALLKAASRESRRADESYCPDIAAHHRLTDLALAALVGTHRAIGSQAVLGLPVGGLP
jgi:hypothetical protein